VYKVFKHIILLFFPLLLFGQQKVDTTYVYGKQSIQFDFTKDEIKQAEEFIKMPLNQRILFIKELIAKNDEDDEKDKGTN
jgi:hypothetical protein